MATQRSCTGAGLGEKILAALAAVSIFNELVWLTSQFHFAIDKGEARFTLKDSFLCYLCVKKMNATVKVGYKRVLYNLTNYKQGMRNIILLILLALGLNVQSQDITVVYQISKELEIENVNYILSLYSYEGEDMSKADQLNYLSNDRILQKLNELKISYENHEFDDSSLMPSVVSSFYIISSQNKGNLEIFNNFIEQYSNCQIGIYSYDIINEEENLDKIFKEALRESKLKANKLAQQLNRTLGALKSVKLANESDGTESLNFNLNASIGWTTYPPLSLTKKYLSDENKSISILVFKVYEFTFETK